MSAAGKYETIPVFTPTLAEMRDFSGLLASMEKKGAAKYGLCRIKPPKDWTWSCDLAKARKCVIDTPILQVVNGRAGAFTVTNLVQDQVTVAQFEKVARSKQPESVDELIKRADWTEIERKFWKSITTTSEPPMYGADTVATLFGDADVPFNVNKLDCMLKKCGVDLPGVTKPMVYAGMYRAFFAYHTEDLNMFSINFLHHGSPKLWYAVPPAYASRVESLAKSLWPDETCPELLRHKTKLLSPMRLNQAGIPVWRGVQQQGDIMITWPESFHSGFNAGFNLAESVNFVPPSLWRFFLPFARAARRPDSISINVDWLERAFKRGGPLGPGDAESSDDDEVPPPPLDASQMLVDPHVGQPALYWVDGDWLRVSVVAVLDDFVKIHEPGAWSAEDLWVPVDSAELRRCADAEPAKKAAKKRAAEERPPALVKASPPSKKTKLTAKAVAKAAAKAASTTPAEPKKRRGRPPGKRAAAPAPAVAPKAAANVRRSLRSARRSARR